MRIGIGYDLHRFCEGKSILLGGVEIPHNKSLCSHSDGDVLTHAIMDALLGAASLPDIGCLFSDQDPHYLHISSLKLLEKVKQLLSDNSFEIVNIDAVIIAEQPKIAPHYLKIKETLATVLNLPIDRIGIKSSTDEKIGSIGEQKAIRAQAVCLLQKQGAHHV